MEGPLTQSHSDRVKRVKEPLTRCHSDRVKRVKEPLTRCHSDRVKRVKEPLTQCHSDRVKRVEESPSKTNSPSLFVHSHMLFKQTHNISLISSFFGAHQIVPRSVQFGLINSIKNIFFLLAHFLICFSLAIA